MADADIMAALVALATATPAITDLTGEHIYPEEIPPAAVAQMADIQALVFQSSGGPSLTGGSEAALDHQRIDVKAYGATPAEANALRRAVAQLLRTTKRKVVSNTLIHWINKAGGFYAARDADGQWPHSFQSFQVFYSTQEVNP
jgi:hypothetical protein